MKIQNTLYAIDRDFWRAWLKDHHESENEVWLVFYKKHTSHPGINYIDAVEEALCFGWIDSVVQRMDEEKYAQKFTPRRNNSKWSALNKKRVYKLVKEGKMTPAGLAKINFTLTDIEKHPDPSKREVSLTEDLLKLLKDNPIAWENFNKLPPSQRKNYAGWIMSAKREDTRRRRLKEAIELLSQGKKLGLK